MNKQGNALSQELKELRQVEADIISLYFNTVSNYSNINKSLETIIEDEEIQYSNIIDLQNKLFEKVIVKVHDTKDIKEFREKVEAIIQTLKQIDS